MMYVDPYGLWEIKLDLGPVGFSIGDKGVSVTAYSINVGVDFRDGSVYGGIRFGLGVKVDIGAVQFGAGASIGYSHNFTRGGPDMVYATAGVTATAFGFGGSFGVSSVYSDGYKQDSFGSDWLVDVNQVQKTLFSKSKEDMWREMLEKSRRGELSSTPRMGPMIAMADDYELMNRYLAEELSGYRQGMNLAINEAGRVVKGVYNGAANVLNSPYTDGSLYLAHYGSVALIPFMPELVVPLTAIYFRTGTLIQLKEAMPPGVGFPML